MAKCYCENLFFHHFELNDPSAELNDKFGLFDNSKLLGPQLFSVSLLSLTQSSVIVVDGCTSSCYLVTYTSVRKGIRSMGYMSITSVSIHGNTLLIYNTGPGHKHKHNVPFFLTNFFMYFRS